MNCCSLPTMLFVAALLLATMLGSPFARAQQAGESPGGRAAVAGHGDLLIAAPGWNGGTGKGYLFLHSP